MMDLRELYQEIIMDHNRNPRHHHAMADATCEAKGFNPLCGDLFETFHHMLTSDDAVVSMDKLAVLAGVRAFPARVKCATLAWHTLDAALKKDSLVVSTE